MFHSLTPDPLPNVILRGTVLESEHLKLFHVNCMIWHEVLCSLDLWWFVCNWINQQLPLLYYKMAHVTHKFIQSLTLIKTLNK